ncbi:MAG: ArsR family transcriptional regulator [Bacillales bacterium]|jgi:predicted transcriptional regulator|nr:ArsR family transcriptional regulator [Bacillales bacterium]
MLNEIKTNIFEENEKILSLGRVLSSPDRLEILRLLNLKSMSIKELSDRTCSPLSTTWQNISILQECGFINVQKTYNNTGKINLCSRILDKISINLYKPESHVSHDLNFEIPIGNFTSYEVQPGCGMASANNTLGIDNDESIFFNEERGKASLIWFHQGFLEYRLASKMLPKTIKQLSLSFEACSEAPFYRNDWKSDITVWINNIEIGTWTCPGDFGGRPGKHNPRWWPKELTQYGILTNWEINEEGVFLDKSKISSLKISELNIKDNNYISLKIGIKKDSKYIGGINLFGKSFGDYEQDICINISW